MSRTMEATIPPEITEEVLREFNAIDGIYGLRLQPRGSIKPPGDLVTINATTEGIFEAMRRLQARGLGTDERFALVSTTPTSAIFPNANQKIATDSSEATWEEMEEELAEESNMTVNGLLVMAISGSVAVIGLSTNALHLVIGAMVIAPGFEPVVRTALGIISGGAGWRLGISHTIKGYLALIAGAAVTALLLRWTGSQPMGGESSYFPPETLISYWTTLTKESVLVSAIASAGGGILIAAHRAVLTSGVMIALAFVPSAALVGMGLVTGQFDIAIQGAIRWLIEFGLVFCVSLMVFFWKRHSNHRRSTTMWL